MEQLSSAGWGNIAEPQKRAVLLMSLTVTGGPGEAATATLPSGVLRVKNEVKTWTLSPLRREKRRRQKFKCLDIPGRWWAGEKAVLDKHLDLGNL